MTAPSTPRLSTLSSGLQGSAILGIAAEVRAAQAQGEQIVNLTVGDFSPREFPVPAVLRDALVEAVRGGECNYPPSNGLEALRSAIAGWYRASFGREHPLGQILVTAGARPAIYALFRAVVDPGDRVVFGVPSWNNEAYAALVGAEAVVLPCDASTDFFPTAERLAPALRGARMLCLNSPLNPTGTVIGRDALAAICDVVLAENRRRGGGERPLYVMYDQVYWTLRFGGAEHVDPIMLRPEMAPYTVLVDAISKSFASTGLRVGWGIGPEDIIAAMGDIATHSGAWAPRPEQIATARLLTDRAVIDDYAAIMCTAVSARLSALGDAMAAMKRDGLPVDSLQPQGAIYLSARFALHGRQSGDGTILRTNEDIRRYLLREAGMAVVPFRAFGSTADDGWFRLSVGVVSVEDIRALMPRVREAIGRLAD